jgi:hypothetical protein
MASERQTLGAASDREDLLDELARCFVQAAVARLLKERREAAVGVQCRSPTQEPCRQPSNTGQASLATGVRKRRSRRGRTDVGARPRVKCKAGSAA